jgi:hypothetical protein
VIAALLALMWLGGPPGCPGCTVVKLARVPKDAPRVSSRGLPLLGVHRKVNIKYGAARNWTTLPDGRPAWRIALYSPQARGLRIHFTGFPEGKGEAWVWSGDGAGEQRGGPYRSGGDFWSDIVFGDTIVVEYRPASAEKVVPFRIPEIAHLLSQ